MSKRAYMSKDEFLTMLSNLDFKCVDDFNISIITEFDFTRVGEEVDPRSYTIRYDE